MPRPASVPTTALGAAIQAKRGETPGHEAAAALGLTPAGLYRIERGERRPAIDTALLLAPWLGWTVARIAEAARQPADALSAEERAALAGAPLPPQDTPTLDPEPVAEVVPVLSPDELVKRALLLPDGRTLSAWGPGPAGLLVRSGCGALAVAAGPTEAWVRIGGVAYRDREAGRSVEERQREVDAFLVREGAQVQP